MKDWSFADQLGDVFGDSQGSHFSSLHEHLSTNHQAYVNRNRSVNAWDHLANHLATTADETLLWILKWNGVLTTAPYFVPP
jgi:hypothetical protein